MVLVALLLATACSPKAPPGVYTTIPPSPSRSIQLDSGDFLETVEVPWSVVAVKDSRWRAEIHDFCGGRLPSDEFQFSSERSLWSGETAGQFVYLDQWLVGYITSVGPDGVREIRDAALACTDYDINNAHWSGSGRGSFSSCGEVKASVDFPEFAIFSYCELAQDAGGDFYAIHSYIGYDGWIYLIRLALRDEAQALEYSSQLINKVTLRLAERFEV